MRARTAARIRRRLGTLANTLNEFLMRDRTGTVVVEGVEQRLQTTSGQGLDAVVFDRVAELVIIELAALVDVGPMKRALQLPFALSPLVLQEGLHGPF